MKAFLFYILLLSHYLVIAQDGTLDLTFHFDGRVNTDFGMTNDYAHSIEIQTDGKIVVGGKSHNGVYYDFALAKYNTDGTLDNTFGFSGLVTTSIQDDDMIRAIKILSDGKILAVGTTKSGAWIHDFCIVKYNSNGTLDNTFGSSGKVILDVGNPSDFATSLDIQSDGKIIVAGHSSNSTDYDFAVVRLNSDGSVDNTFGSSGIVKKAIGSGNDEAFSVKLQSDGKILIGGRYHNGSNMDFAVIRLNSNGDIDNTFGSSGVVTANFDNRWDSGFSLVIQSDGKILLAGTAEITASNMDFACIRLNSDGTFDNTFGSLGKVSVNVNDINDYCYSLLIQSDNKLLFGGATTSSFALLRLNSDGSIDYSFDSDGKVITLFASSYSESNSMAIQSDGKILVAGNAYLWNGFMYTYDFAITRYENPSILPVELIYFNASKKYNSIVLNWQTVTEVNNFGFEIEKMIKQSSENNKQYESTWKKIGFVQGQGNSNSPKEYTFVDENINSGFIKYRLKQIDNDGSYRYSDEIEIIIEALKNFELYQNYPNPFNPTTNISFTIAEDGWVSLKIYNILGQEIQTLISEELKSGRIYNVSFNGSSLASGIYVYKLESRNQSKVKKFVLMK